MPSNYRGGPKRNDGKIAEKFRDACPPHKVKDLDSLVKQCKGNEKQIEEKIQQWWEEPAIEEPQWEAVAKNNKKAPEKSSSRGGGRGGDRGASRANDRGDNSGRTERRGDRSYGSGGRDGPRRDSRGGGRASGRYGDRDKNRDRQKSTPAPAGKKSAAPKKKESGVPTPVTNAPIPKGAWGTGGQSFAAAAASSSTPAASEPQATPAMPEPENSTPVVEQQPKEEAAPVDIGVPAVNIIATEDPTPSGMPAAPPVASGNVWGSKGGAHLIQAVKQPTPAQIPLAPEVDVEPEPVEQAEEPVVVEEPEPAMVEQTLVKESSFGLDNVLPSVNGANINASGWEPILDSNDSTSQQQQQQLEPSPVGAISAAPSMPEPEPISLPKPTAAEPIAPSAPVGMKPNNVLNMGRWETGDGDDDLDFGFGSFGAPENDTEATTATASSTSASQTPSASAAPGASPARPPPGLSMPPMPTNAMLVHELEGKLDNTTLGTKVETNNTTATAQSSQPQLPTVNGLGNPPGMSQYNGMGGMFPSAGVPNALGSMPTTQFPLTDTSTNNQQQSNAQQNDSRSGLPSQLNQQGTTQPQQSAYAMQPTAAGVQSNTAGAPGTTSAPNGGVNVGAPGSGNAPGMPPSMQQQQQQYPNPAYMYAQPNQFNQMGHPAYGMQAAAYGYGQQFAPQGGHQFGGYNQPGLMGQGGGGYGAPSHYDDQRGGPRGGNNNNNMRDSGGYNKGGGRGYRGNRNNHHQNNHGSGYGNNNNNNYGQSNPNVGGGYGASPYGNMGYGGHQGGYGNPNAGPSGMDHYGMQQQQQQGGHGEKSGGNQPFQQQSHLHQQPLGLQGASTETGTAGGASSGGGWPGQSRQNWGGNWQQEN